MERQATVREIRNHYKSQGCKVKISFDGHVTYREDGDAMWLEGRWVEEYWLSDKYGVQIQ